MDGAGRPGIRPGIEESTLRCYLNRVRLPAKLLPVFLPLVVRWAEREEARILRTGEPLSRESRLDAARAGVSRPEKIRLLKVPVVPAPRHPLLRAVGQLTGLLSPATAGMSLRYGIFIRWDCWGDRHLIAHECVHTAQCERLGGLEPFLRQYLLECLTDGYYNSRLEREAVETSSAISPA